MCFWNQSIKKTPHLSPAKFFKHTNTSCYSCKLLSYREVRRVRHTGFVGKERISAILIPDFEAISKNTFYLYLSSNRIKHKINFAMAAYTLLRYRLLNYREEGSEKEEALWVGC